MALAKPSSRAVGTSGLVGERASLSTQRARTLPSRMKAVPVAQSIITLSTVPESRSCMAAGPPR